MNVTAWIDAAKARADAATEGPWDSGDHEGHLVVAPNRYGNADDSYWIADTWYANGNAEFIAAARTDLPKALDALRAVLDLVAMDREDHIAAMRDYTPVVAKSSVRDAIATVLEVTP